LCKKKPATPNPAAKIAAMTRGSETEPSVRQGQCRKGRPAAPACPDWTPTNHFGENDEDNIDAAPMRLSRRGPPGDRTMQPPQGSRTRSWRCRRGGYTARSWSRKQIGGKRSGRARLDLDRRRRLGRTRSPPTIAPQAQNPADDMKEVSRSSDGPHFSMAGSQSSAKKMVVTASSGPEPDPRQTKRLPR